MPCPTALEASTDSGADEPNEAAAGKCAGGGFVKFTSRILNYRMIRTRGQW